MKAVLEFELPEDGAEFGDATNGTAWKLAMWDFDNWLRGKLKHGDLPDAEHAALQSARDYLHECLQDRGLSLD